MAHGVFISYAEEDKKTANEVCSTLESISIKCWLAHRNNAAGQLWGKGIAKAITSSQVMVFILSNSSASPSEAIMNEIVAADSKAIPIVVLRIDNVEPSEELAFYIRKYHWIDAFDGKLKAHLQELASAVENLVVPTEADTGTKATAEVQDTAATPEPREEEQRSFSSGLAFWLKVMAYLLVPCGISFAIAMVAIGNSNTLSFSYNFSDANTAGWQLDPGWQVVSDSGNYVLDCQTQDTVKQARLNSTDLPTAYNYQLEADFRIMSGMLELQAEESTNGAYGLFIAENQVHLIKESSGSNLADNISTGINLNQWHKLKIIISGRNIQVYIDGNQVINYSDSNPVPSDNLVLKVHPQYSDNSPGHVQVDNIVIQPD